MGQNHGKAQLIYENYKPKNTQEMREYILYTIDKSLQKAKKQGLIDDKIQQLIGQIGNPRNLSSELKSYLYLKKNREISVLNYNSQQNEIQAQNQQENSSFSSIGPHCLLFDSFFECGNLEKAEYVSPTEYNLYLNVDTNTKGHQQWFYFKVKNTFKDKKYTFHIRNFTKPFSLYRQGMKIMMKSKKHQEESECQEQDGLDTGWVPAGEDITYWRTDIQRSGWRVPGPLNLDDEEDDDQILDDINGIDGVAALNTNQDNKKVQKRAPNVNQMLQGNYQNMRKRKRYFYTLTFKVEFDYDDDVVYFAYSTPYPYSKIFLNMLKSEQKLIQSQLLIPENTEFKVINSNHHYERNILTKEFSYQRRLFCRSISGLPVPLITVTARKNRGLDLRKRQAICISARVHPGETNSNYVFDGIMQFLFTQEGIQQLLYNYVFKLIPCLNPDGNVCGNYRSSLAGVDLNRQWILPNRELHPIVYQTKEMISQLSKERQLLVYCDLHCHSKKKNSFIYGCNTAANGGFTSWTKVRLLPRILARQTPLFNLKDCRFKVDPGKLGTARVIIWKEFGVTNSFTLENSFFAYNHGKDVIQFTPKLYYEMGESLGKSLIQYRLCLKQIEKELILTNGWLKPKLLLEVTGTPAAEKIATDAEQRLKEERKRKKIEEYKLSIGLLETGENSHNTSVIKNQTNEDKTRNIQRAKTQNQNKISIVSTTLEEKLKKQQTNTSDKNKALVLNKESSTESTKVDSMLKYATQSQDDNPNFDAYQRYNNQENGKSKHERVMKIQKFIKKYLKVQKESNSDEKISSSNHSTLFPIIQKVHYQRQMSKTNGQITPHDKDTPKIIPSIKIGDLSNSRCDSRSQLNEDWRDFFKETELEQAFEQIQLGEDPDEKDQEEMSDAGSEDNISDDNLDINELYKEVYMRDHAMDKEIALKQKAENKAKQDLKKLNTINLSSNKKSSQNTIQSKGNNDEQSNNTTIQNLSQVISAQFNLMINTPNSNQEVMLRQRKFSQNTGSNKQQNVRINDLGKYNNFKLVKKPPLAYQEMEQQSFHSNNQKRPSSQLGVVNCLPDLAVDNNDRGATPEDADLEQFAFINQYTLKNIPQQSEQQRVLYHKQITNTPYQLSSKFKIQSQYFNSSHQYDRQSSRQINKSLGSDKGFTNQSESNQSGFQQYILKNLRYEGPKVQQAYSKMKNTQNNVLGAMQYNQQSNQDIIQEHNQTLNRSINKKKLKVEISDPQKKLNALTSNNSTLNAPAINNLKDPQSNLNLQTSAILLNQEVQHGKLNMRLYLPTLKTNNSNTRKQQLSFATNLDQRRGLLDLNRQNDQFGFQINANNLIKKRRVTIHQTNSNIISTAKIERSSSNNHLKIYQF